MDIFSYLATHFDLPILEWIAANLHCAVLDTLMPIFSFLGDGGALWIGIALVLLLIPKYRPIGLSMAVSLIMGLVLCNVLLKPLCARIRPYDYQMLHFGKEIPLLVEKLHDFSFPSGHTIASFEAATVLTLYSKKAGIPALIVASLIAFSRLYLYVHYPSDVLFSVVLGIAIAFFSRFLTEKAITCYRSKKEKNL
mgnify:CR=1 FL=1